MGTCAACENQMALQLMTRVPGSKDLLCPSCYERWWNQETRKRPGRG